MDADLARQLDEIADLVAARTKAHAVERRDMYRRRRRLALLAYETPDPVTQKTPTLKEIADRLRVSEVRASQLLAVAREERADGDQAVDL